MGYRRVASPGFEPLGLSPCAVTLSPQRGPEASRLATLWHKLQAALSLQRGRDPLGGCVLGLVRAVALP